MAQLVRHLNSRLSFSQAFLNFFVITITSITMSWSVERAVRFFTTFDQCFARYNIRSLVCKKKGWQVLLPTFLLFILCDDWFCVDNCSSLDIDVKIELFVFTVNITANPTTIRVIHDTVFLYTFRFHINP